MTITAGFNQIENANGYHIPLNSLNPYQAMRLADTCSGVFLTGQLLVPFERERLYVERCAQWMWPNFIKPILNALTDPIFEKQAFRSEVKSDFWNSFTQDVDLKGRTLQKFMKLAARESNRMGSAFIVVDNFSDMPATKDEVLKQRKFPYLYLRTPENVVHYSKDRSGNLSSITFKENSGNVNYNIGDMANNNLQGINQNSNGVANWQEATKDSEFVYVEWSKNSYKVFKDRDKKDLLSTFDHKLNKLPVVVLYGTDNTEEILPTPPLYPILQINLNIAGISSEIRALERSQAFAQLIYPVDPENDVTANKGATLGTSNMLRFDGNLSHAPAYISPDSSIVKSLQDEIVRLVGEMFRISSLESVNSEQKDRSGISKQWAFRITNSVLSQLAESTELAEKTVANIFSLWTKEKSLKDYSISYTRDYGVLDSLSELSLVELAKSLNVGKVFDEELNKRIARIMFREDDPTILQRIIDDITQEAIDRKNAEDAGINLEDDE